MSQQPYTQSAALNTSQPIDPENSYIVEQISEDDSVATGKYVM